MILWVFIASLAAWPSLAGEIPAAIKNLAADGARSQELATAINMEKIRGGYSDMVPLANAFISEAGAAASKEDAAAYLNAAKIAAPAEPRVWAATAKNAFSISDFGTAFSALKSFYDTLWADPWFTMALPVWALMVACCAAIIVAVGLTVTMTPYYFPLFFHDFKDMFKIGLRRFLPYAALILIASAVLAALPGLLILFIAISVINSVYIPKKVLVPLGVALVLMVLTLSALQIGARITGQPGERAFLLYRVMKGDAGKEISEKIGSAFGEEEYEAILSRIYLERRAHNLDNALYNAQKAASKFPGESLPLQLIGNILYQKKDAAAAVKAYEKAAEADPDDWMIWYNLGMLYTARLDLARSQDAMARAEAAGAAAMKRYEINAPVVSGEITLAEPQIPHALMKSQMKSEVQMPSWLTSAWGLMGGKRFTITPFYLAGVITLILVAAYFAKRHRLSIRCISCGKIKCQRCHPRGKSMQICDACWSLKNASGMDETSIRRMKESIQQWTVKTGFLRKLGAYLFPGFSRYIVDTGGTVNLIFGVVWAFAVAWLISSFMAPVPFFSWGQSGAPWVAGAITLICHIISARTSERF
ncbi:tetratricopeptide repeat protein [bacterium]|nr:MAG: tetratricopeptide repeat protein [bacterium]